MALSLHTTKTYKVEYGQNAINGWGTIDKFISHLYDLRRENSGDYDDIFISEDETSLAIPFSVLEEMTHDKDWGEVARTILDNSDKSNDYAHLFVW